MILVKNLYNFIVIGFSIFCILLAIATFIIILEKSYSEEKAWEIILYGLGIGFVVCTILWFIFLKNYQDRNYTFETKLDRTNIIVSTKDNSNINGQIRGRRFYLRGFINEEWQYSVYVKSGEKYNIVNLPSKITTIYETDGQPHFDTYCKFALEGQRTFLIFKEKWDYHNSKNCWYDLYVPKGSISNEYNLDAE